MTQSFSNEALESLFEPKSIAILGARDRVNRPEYDSINNAFLLGWQGKMYPVTPKYLEIAGGEGVSSTWSDSNIINLKSIRDETIVHLRKR